MRVAIVGHRLSDLHDDNKTVRLAFANGDRRGGPRDRRRRRALAGAPLRDRRSVQYSGTSAFRGIVPVGRLPSLPDPQAIQFWMGPDAHLLHYAIGGDGGAVNFFAVTEGRPNGPAATAGRSTSRPETPRRSSADGTPPSPK